MPSKKAKYIPEDDADDYDMEEYSEDSEDEFQGPAMNDFELPECLQPVNWHRRTVKDIVAMLKGPYCDLNPDYQRDFVWSSDRMIRLINSIMTDFYVPPVIFNVIPRTDANGVTKFHRISVDGKQRLTSIKLFVEGKVPCTDKHNRRWFFVDDGERTGTIKKKRVLSNHIKQMFLQKELLTAEFSALDRRQEEDLFSRVQLGMPLTPAEKLKASSGHWQTFAIQIETKFPDLLNIFDNKRGRGFQLVLQLLKQICFADETLPGSSQSYSTSVSTLKTFCAKPKDILNRIKGEAGRVFRKYDEIHRKFPQTFAAKSNWKHSTKFSPVEFVGIGVLIHRYPNRNARLLSGDIMHLRQYLRDQRQDLRANTVTWRCIMSFINNIERYRGSMDTGDSRDAEELGKEPPENDASDIFSVSAGDISLQNAVGRTHPSTRGGHQKIVTDNQQGLQQLAPLPPPSPLRAETPAFVPRTNPGDQVQHREQIRTSTPPPPPPPLQMVPPTLPHNRFSPPANIASQVASMASPLLPQFTSQQPQPQQGPQPRPRTNVKQNWESIQRLVSVKRESPFPETSVRPASQSPVTSQTPTFPKTDATAPQDPRSALKRRWAELEQLRAVKKERVE